MTSDSRVGTETGPETRRLIKAGLHAGIRDVQSEAGSSAPSPPEQTTPDYIHPALQLSNAQEFGEKKKSTFFLFTQQIKIFSHKTL